MSPPDDGTIALPPPGRSWFRQGDLNSVISSTRLGDHTSVSAEVPSTAPPMPSDVATSIRSGLPELGSAVTRTPDLSFGTDSRMTTEASTHSGSSIERLAPGEGAELERRGPDLLEALVDVVERLAVEQGQVEPGAVEVVEILDVGVAAHEAARSSGPRRS